MPVDIEIRYRFTSLIKMYIVHRFIFLVIILELHIANIKIDIGAIHVDEQVNSEIDVPILVAGLSPGGK